MAYPALLPLKRTPRLPVVAWTDSPAYLNGLIRFAERRNLVSVSVPSHFNWPLLHCTLDWRVCDKLLRGVPTLFLCESIWSCKDVYLQTTFYTSAVRSWLLFNNNNNNNNKYKYNIIVKWAQEDVETSYNLLNNNNNNSNNNNNFTNNHIGHCTHTA